MDDNQTGSIILRRGPTDDRLEFTPLRGEIIYDSATQQIFVGDAETAGGKPAFGDKIEVDNSGNITGIYLLDKNARPDPENGLLRYNANNNTLEYADGERWNLVGSNPTDNQTNVLYVSSAGRDDSTFGDKRGRTPGTALKTLNAACREAERIVKDATKGLGPYVKTITYNQGTTVSSIDTIIDVFPYKKLTVTNGNVGLDAEKEIKPGFRIIGQTSGAKAIIEEYAPGTSTTDDIVIEVEEGEFVVGESLKFGAAIPSTPFSDSIDSVPEITIFLATGIYYEDFPIKVPVNTSIKGDEFRRSIVRPRPGMSRSPYAEVAFKRDNDKIGLSEPGKTFGRHYLTDKNAPITNLIRNEGGFEDASNVIAQNKNLIIDSFIDYIEQNHSKLSYDETIFRRDAGLVLDALVLDLTFGGSREILHTALSYYSKEPALTENQVIAVAAGIEHLTEIITAFLEIPAAIDTVDNFLSATAQVIRGNFNSPKDNEKLDVLLMNDSTIVRNLTVQRHGGFMEVLDPEGQIKTRSPYTQTASSFSRSQAPQVSFAGGMFIDGFSGNLDVDLISVLSDTEIILENFEREPQWPTSFFINGSRFQINKIDTVGVSDNQLRAVLSDETPWQDSYYQIVNQGSSLPSFPISIEVLTAGNVSMLSNDFTQINDLGYGLYCTNAARAEAVGVFTYYCHKAYFSEKGSEIRSLNGSCAYGDFALVASDSDPLEVPDTVNLTQDLIQTAEIFTSADFENRENDIQVFVTNYDYFPFNNSELEIDHIGTFNADGDEIEFVRYSITGVSQTNIEGVVQLNLSSDESTTAAAGLATDLSDGTPVTIRQNQLLQVNNVRDVQPTRPSTALVFNDDVDTVYRVLDYDISTLPANTANLRLGQSYDYVKLNIADTAGTDANSGQAGDTVLRLEIDLDEKETERITNAIQKNEFYEFGFNGILHQIVGYRNQSQTGEDYAEIDIQPPLNKSLADYTNKPVLRAGPKSGSTAEITVRISTLRATSHDMLDIGTGSFQDSNYPQRIFGAPEKPARQENEISEQNKGRVFFSTSDQDGNFRVGDFFKVDQGTGTVTFAATIALSNLDGIGFKRGVAIAEFSTDDSMLDNASDTVPVESAVRQYVNRRLGLSHNDSTVTSLIGPGYIDRDGNLPMTGDLNLNANNIINLKDPEGLQDAATKNYVDTRTFSVNTISGNLDNNISLNTDNLPEGSNNQYFSTLRARQSISVTQPSGDGSIVYNTNTGIISYTGPSAAETRAHFSAGGDLVYDQNQGKFSFSERTDSQVRGLFSAAGDLTYNDSSGTFSVTTISDKTTDDLSEGIVNRYYNDSLVDSHLSGGPGIDYSGGVINHSNTSSAASVDNSGGTVVQDISIDTFGHVTDIGTKSLTAADVGALPSNGKATDSSLLDGLDSNQFLRADATNNFIDFNNNEQDTYDVDGRLYWDLSAGLYIKSSNSNSTSARLLWSGANVSSGGGIDITYGSEDEPTISHSNTSSASSANNSGNNFVQDITVDTYGHVTAITSSSPSINFGDVQITGFINGYDRDVNYTTPDGSVIVGEFSRHLNSTEDRRFRFRYRSISI